MGAEEQTPQNGTTAAEPTGANSAPPPEEPPKMEDIVTLEVLQQVVKGYNPELRLVTWEAQLGSKIGDNYMSIMYAVELDLEDEKGENKEKLEIMLKTIPRNIFRAEMINEMQAFKKESLIYQQVLPIFAETQEKNDIVKDDMFLAWPRCYAAHVDGTTDFLALENMKVAGYTMGSRVQGLDFNHCAVVLSNLAKFHAISFVKYDGSRDKILEDFPILLNTMFDKTNKMAEMQQNFFSQSFKSQGETLREMGEELAASRLEKLSKANLCDEVGALLGKSSDCAVITHGDCWVNNMLFKYSDKDTKGRCPTDVKFIDFQLSQAASRLVDVYYFLMTSCKVDVLNEREQDLQMIYYTQFTSYAEALGLDTKKRGLTWENFLAEADCYRLYGVFMGLLLAPMLAADAADIPDMDSYTQEDLENTDETIQKFFKDLNKGHATQKAKMIVLNHLPKCNNGAQFL